MGRYLLIYYNIYRGKVCQFSCNLFFETVKPIFKTYLLCERYIVFDYKRRGGPAVTNSVGDAQRGITMGKTHEDKILLKYHMGASEISEDELSHK